MTIGIPLSPRLVVAATSTFIGMLRTMRRAGPVRWAESLVRELGVAPGNRRDVPLLQHCRYWSHVAVTRRMTRLVFRAALIISMAAAVAGFAFLWLGPPNGTRAYR